MLSLAWSNVRLGILQNQLATRRVVQLQPANFSCYGSVGNLVEAQSWSETEEKEREEAKLPALIIRSEDDTLLSRAKKSLYARINNSVF